MGFFHGLFRNVGELKGKKKSPILLVCHFKQTIASFRDLARICSSAIFVQRDPL